jgi:hypothetical protein
MMSVMLEAVFAAPAASPEAVSTAKKGRETPLPLAMIIV